MHPHQLLGEPRVRSPSALASLWTTHVQPERPLRLQYVMAALKQLKLEDAECAARLDVREVKTSEAMLAALLRRRFPLATATRSAASRPSTAITSSCATRDGEDRAAG